MSNTNSEPFIIAINNDSKSIYLIEFFEDGSLKSVTVSANYKNAFNSSTIKSIETRVDYIYNNINEDGFVNGYEDLSCAIPGIRYHDDSNIIIEQAPKYVFSSGDLHYSAKAYAIDELENKETITAYIPWHIVHFNIFNNNEVEINVYISDKKINLLNEEVYFNTLLNKKLFKEFYAFNKDLPFSYGSNNEFFLKVLDKVEHEISEVTKLLNIKSKQDFINYNNYFISQKTDTGDVKISLQSIIQNSENFNQSLLIESNKDLLEFFKNNVFLKSTTITGHKALAMLFNDHVLDKSNYFFEYQTKIWHDFDLTDSNFEQYIGNELFQFAEMLVYNNVGYTDYIDNHNSSIYDTIDSNILQEIDIQEITLEEVNHFVSNIQQNMSTLQNVSES